ncbi:hypothetical protein BSL78_28125 [Apostichopus japonicus]|uniref:Uncharacterized protein n=1 Tax=Stichopus japonicus TaxID=307972 RepID=A0A2G8JH48_STIJA|nr:hypothetical protein BSL78_28125 [Apostichopus japonicus]
MQMTYMCCFESGLLSRTLAGFIYFERATGAKLNPKRQRAFVLVAGDTETYHSVRRGRIRISKLMVYGSATMHLVMSPGTRGLRYLRAGSKPLAPAGFRSRESHRINRFVSPILWYPGAVYPIPRRVLVRLGERYFHLFGRVVQSLSKGGITKNWRRVGLGVVHLGSKLTFLLFKQLFVAVTDPGLPCSYFVRFWGGLHLRRWVPALFSNREPHSSTPNRVVRVICSALIELPPVDLSQPALVHSSLRIRP